MVLVQAKWYYYILLGLVDVEAKFLVVKAYQYTSLTSVMLLDCWSIPCVMLFTWIFIKTKYRFKKIIGLVVCIAGFVLVVLSDEFLVKNADRVELMAMLGLFGGINGSTMLNLSLLTSDMCAILIRIFAYHEKVDWMYCGLCGDGDENQDPHHVAFGLLGFGQISSFTPS
ncbi:Solute carrier family 35 member F1 [Glycine soja]|uniref:Solute carrier family 35 member F1 n=1 Tax=Glycine soja TaxID=3848 RepID=A0A445FA52_GLYSO|nr:Solute carrier family 35 member F1 [Glycine soja]